MSLEPEPSLPADEQATRGLVQRLLAGDRAAADELFSVHRERLRRAIRPYFRAEHRALLDEDELLQRALVRAFHSIERFEWRGKGAFLAWIKTIAIRELQRELRSGARGAHRDPSTVADLASLAPSPSDALHRREQHDRLERALHELPDEDRNAIVNRQILGQDYETLATDLGITRGAVRMKVARAMARLARELEADG
ncbi:MAG: RNA polymerase sigma factor [Planctomycetota bacterium]